MASFGYSELRVKWMDCSGVNANKYQRKSYGFVYPIVWQPIGEKSFIKDKGWSGELFMRCNRWSLGMDK